jgi:hypothetical protein
MSLQDHRTPHRLAAILCLLIVGPALGDRSKCGWLRDEGARSCHAVLGSAGLLTGDGGFPRCDFRLAVGREPQHSVGMPDHAVWTLFGKLIGAAAIAALLVSPASAQALKMPGIDLNPDGRSQRVLTPEEKEKQKALDDKYKESMQKIPDKKAPADPWGNIRAAPTTPSTKQR